MSLMVLDKEIQRIHVIDDDPMVRDAYLETVKDMGLEGVDVSTPIKDIESLFDSIDPKSDGIIFDYQLNSTKYSAFNGDVYGRAAYEKHIPFIISSHFTPLSMEGRRRFIPKAVHVDLLEPRSVLEAFELCVGEYQGKFITRRVPIRTLVRIEGMHAIGDTYELNVVVPNWDPHTGIQIRVDIATFPSDINIEKELHENGAARITAEVNTGAQDVNEIYFSNWRAL
jgi:hypothetical protein